MTRIFNVSHRKVGGLHFVRIGRLGFSWYITSKPVHKEPRTHTRQLDDVKYHRQYEGGSTVVVYHDR
jgi:hypothetical protein